MQCAHTNQDCSNEGGCCSLNDVCVTLHDEMLDDTMMIAPRKCKTIYRYSRSIPRNGRCDDSRECYDRCCQEYRGHRYGSLYRCGSQIEGRIAHTCIVRHL
ncbi:hypothetical protein PoB_001678700 [Plakobranchus ocellatus]|uniref:WAP domain-containing protein n=1 Tax=Plakobranchus ocellatus TaxID=259542 RepID=A0AAV3Z6Y6_9GAST|nr:hypothetical protein PoB_001678700 [Plakobranchus ocellatus]